MDTWPSGISAVTLFVEDLAAARQFYQDVFGLPVVFADDASAVFRFGETLINLLSVTAASGLMAPATVASPEAGSRVQFTITVADVDAMCAELTGRGWSCSTTPWTGPGASGPPASRTPAGTSGRSRPSDPPGMTTAPPHASTADQPRG